MNADGGRRDLVRVKESQSLDEHLLSSYCLPGRAQLWKKKGQSKPVLSRSSYSNRETTYVRYYIVSRGELNSEGKALQS